MTTRADLLALADRCEREEPSAVLDAAIAVAIRRGPADAPTYFVEKFPVWKSRSDGRVEVVHDDGRGGAHWAPAAFTSDINVAVTLVPSDGFSMQWSWRVGNTPGGGFAIIGTSKIEHTAKTPALALVAAALRARAAMVPE